MLQGFEDIARLSAFEVDENQLRNELLSLAFFTAQRAVIVDEVEKLDVKKGENMLQVLEKVPASTLVILKARKLEGNRKWAKSLKALAQVIDCQPLKPYERKKILRAELSKIDLGYKEIEYLLTTLPQDLASCYNEIEKLSLYPDKLDLKLLKLLVEPALEEQVFSLVDLLIRKDWQGSVRILKELLASGNEPMAILGAILWQIRTLYKVCDYNGPISEACKELNLKEFAIQKAKEALKNLSSSQIEDWFLLALETDMNIKSGLLRPDVALEVMVNKICLEIKPSS